MMMQLYSSLGTVTKDGLWFSVATIVLAFICAGTHLMIRGRMRLRPGVLRQDELREDLGPPQQLPRHIPPAHVHVVDFERMLLQVTETNSVYTRCCVSACEEPIYISRVTLEYLKLRVPQIAEARVGAALIAKREASFFDTLPNRRNVKL